AQPLAARRLPAGARAARAWALPSGADRSPAPRAHARGRCALGFRAASDAGRSIVSFDVEPPDLLRYFGNSGGPLTLSGASRNSGQSGTGKALIVAPDVPATE